MFIGALGIPRVALRTAKVLLVSGASLTTEDLAKASGGFDVRPFFGSDGLFEAWMGCLIYSTLEALEVKGVQNPPGKRKVVVQVIQPMTNKYFLVLQVPPPCWVLSHTDCWIVGSPGKKNALGLARAQGCGDAQGTPRCGSARSEVLTAAPSLWKLDASHCGDDLSSPEDLSHCGRRSSPRVHGTVWEGDGWRGQHLV